MIRSEEVQLRTNLTDDNRPSVAKSVELPREPSCGAGRENSQGVVMLSARPLSPASA